MMKKPAAPRPFPLAGFAALIAALAVSLIIVGGTSIFASAQAHPGVMRTYYIAAEEVVWDYAPGGVNRITARPFGETEAHWTEPGPTRIGRIYKKAMYREYTDSTFSTPVARSPEWEHLGILGPLVRAQVGDTIRIVYRNDVHFPTSLHPHGVFYQKDSEGAPYSDGVDEREKYGDAVPPGGTHVYEWPVPERAGPMEGGASTAFWMYHSHADEVRDVNAGLVGPMIVHAPGTLTADGRPSDVDRELVVAFTEFNENESWYIEENVRTYMSDPDAIQFIRGPFGDRIATSDGQDWGGNFMEAINGLAYGHLPGLTGRVGERVRWYVMATTNFEVHAPHWHGNVVTVGNERTDVAQLVSMGMIVADMVPDNPGTWLFHCHVGPHLEGGMTSTYTVLPATVAERPANDTPGGE